jgi:predicted  nucleic acid-binding Zn-ribbon protein
MFGSSVERLEHKIKELNAVKGEYRSDIDQAEHKFKRGEIDKAQLERIRTRNEEHIERINEKIRTTREKQQAMRK